MSPSDKLAELKHQGQIAVSERRAAALIDLSHDTLRRHRRYGTGPAYCRVGGPNGPVRLLIRDLIAWLQSQRFDSRAQEVSRV